jgi:glycosyltransferase involved in cell wall biosynthesis
VPIRVARIIGRLNIGGPALQAIHLVKALEPFGFETRLYRGSESPSEGSMDHLAEELGVRPVLIPTMRREVGPGDAPALGRLIRELRRQRPAIVHTEAAKGGTLGRLAALIAFPRRRPVIVHTFHGHSLEGYFSPRRAAFFLSIERFLARRTTLVLAVSQEVKDDLVRLGVTSAERIRVLRIGLDLRAFARTGAARDAARAAKRAEWGVPGGAPLVTLVARLVPIKRVDRFLRIAGLLADADPAIRFAIVGDGELRDELHASPAALALGERLRWTGFERDMPAVCFASDCVVLTSDNEGTPVSLIEAQAAGVPVVSTRVGGAATVVGEEGLVDADDEVAFAAAVRERLAAGAPPGAAQVTERFSLDALAAELASLYRELLDQTAAHSARSASEIRPAR